MHTNLLPSSQFRIAFDNYCITFPSLLNLLPQVGLMKMHNNKTGIKPYADAQCADTRASGRVSEQGLKTQGVAQAQNRLCSMMRE